MCDRKGLAAGVRVIAEGAQALDICDTCIAGTLIGVALDIINKQPDRQQILTEVIGELHRLAGAAPSTDTRQ